ncbi:hypothetical protein ADL19_20485, partial [Streptomyces purpurogeneiscleroticus]
MSLAYLATTGNRKVHFEFASGALTHMPSCGSGNPIVERLAELDDLDGLEALIVALTAARIAPPRVCRRCFGAK